MDRRSIGALVLALTAALAGCGLTGPVATVPAPVAVSPTGRPAGSPLVDRLRTPPGTLLLGGVFPHPDGASALLLVTGDPIRAMASLVDQAQRAGFRLTPSQSEHPCWTTTAAGDWWTQPPERPLGQQGSAAATGLACDVAGYTAPFSGKRAHLSLRLLVSAGDDPYLAHLAVDYVTTADSPWLPTASAPVRLAMSTSPLQPRPLTRIAGVGSPLGFVHDIDRVHDVDRSRVLTGSALAAPPFPWGMRCGTVGGFAAVVRVTGEAGPVIRGYADHFVAEGLHDRQRRSIRVPGGAATLLRFTTAGGGDGTITAIAVSGDTYLLIDRCED